MIRKFLALVALAVTASAISAQDAGSRGESLQWLRQASGAMQTGDVPKARKLVADAKSWGERQKDKLVIAYANQMMGELEFAAKNSDKAIEAFTSALDAFADLKNPAGMAACRVNLGRILFAEDKVSDALKHQQEALALYQKLNRSSEIAATLADLGSSYKAVGRNADAKDALQKALAMYQDSTAKQPATELRIHRELAACCEATGATDAVKEHLMAALKLAADLKDAVEEARLHSSLGTLYHKQGGLDEAHMHYQAALKLYSVAKNADAAEARTRCNWGALLQDQGKAQSALVELTKALEIQARLNDGAGQARTLYNIAVVHEGLGEEAKAIEAYEKALVLRRKSSDMPGLVKILDNLALLYASQGKAEKAKEVRGEADKLRPALAIRAPVRENQNLPLWQELIAEIETKHFTTRRLR